MLQYIHTKNKEYNEKVKRYLPGGVHYNFKLPWEETPIHFSKGSGSRLWDIDGNEYVDLYAKFGALIVGHGNESYNRSLAECLDRVSSVNHSDIEEEVYEKMSRHIPCAEMIRFGLSGTEIIQNALRLARAFTKKNKFIRFEGHYHGNADNIMGGKFGNRDFPVPVEFVGDFRRTLGRADNILESQSFLIPWNDPDILEETVAKYKNEIAAIITEPICVNGGGIMPKDGYLEKMRSLCDGNDIVLIFDEIITGFRIGLGGAQEKLGVTPDLATFGKAMAGGAVPVSALVGRKEIMKMLEAKTVIHAGTFNGYPLGLAAVNATIDILSEDDGKHYRSMETNAREIHRLLTDAAIDAGIPLVVQGPPQCASYHCAESIITEQKDLTYDVLFKDIIINNTLASYGILVSTVSRMYPNIMLDERDVSFCESRVGDALRKAKETIDSIYPE